MKQANRYEYFNCYRSKETIQQNHEEIERAIDKVTGGKDVDIKIKKIWDRFIR